MLASLDVKCDRKRMISETKSIVDIVPAGSRVLWVASTGGHLEQLVRFAATTEANSRSTWVTFDTQQSRSLLNGRDVATVRYVRPRDARAAIEAARQISPRIHKESYDLCISTGAAVGAIILPIARMRGIPTAYIESVSRTDGPSLTGRLMRAFPGIATYTQHGKWSSKQWAQLKSLLDEWDPVPSRRRCGPLKIFVTLGTIKPYRFDRAVEAVLKLLTPGDQVIWQLGATARDGLPGEVHSELSAEEMQSAIAKSDVVVTHAGVGSILSLLDAGIAPVLAVRESAHREHVDGHQRQIARAMIQKNLAIPLDLSSPSRETLYQATSITVESCPK